MEKEYNKQTSDSIKKYLLRNKLFTDKILCNNGVCIEKINFLPSDIDDIELDLKLNADCIIERFQEIYSDKHDTIINIQSIETFFYKTKKGINMCVTIYYIPKTALEMYLFHREEPTEIKKEVKQDLDSTDVFIALLIFIIVASFVGISFWSFICH